MSGDNLNILYKELSFLPNRIYPYKSNQNMTFTIYISNSIIINRNFIRNNAIHLNGLGM